MAASARVDHIGVPFGLTTYALRSAVFDPQAVDVDVPVLQCKLSHSHLAELGSHALFVGGVAAALNGRTDGRADDIDRCVQWGRVLSTHTRAAQELGLLVPDIANHLHGSEPPENRASVVRAYFGALSLLHQNSLAQQYMAHFMRIWGDQWMEFEPARGAKSESDDDTPEPPAFPAYTADSLDPDAAMHELPLKIASCAPSRQEMIRQPAFWLHQLAVQRGHSINFGFESHGPPHNLTWTASLFLQHRGAEGATLLARGDGASKAEAKNQASVRALEDLGWMAPA